MIQSESMQKQIWLAYPYHWQKENSPYM